MSDDLHMTTESRAPYALLRAWEPARDDDARARAFNQLQLHIAAAESEQLRGAAPSFAERRARFSQRLRLRLQRRWLAPLLALIAVAGAGGVAAAVLLHTAHTNRVPVFTPQGRLSPQFHVGSRGRGYCWEASLASTDANAYRCFQGNEIHDPCFAASSHASSVVCFLDPWHAVTVLRLTRRLPRHVPAPKGPPLPWVIVTSDGRRCVFMTGATALVAGERVNYGCTDGSYLIGDPDTSRALWTIRSDRHLSLQQMHAPLRRFPVVGIEQTIG
jgi:hypothetical protein